MLQFENNNTGVGKPGPRATCTLCENDVLRRFPQAGETHYLHLVHIAAAEFDTHRDGKVASIRNEAELSPDIEIAANMAKSDTCSVPVELQENALLNVALLIVIQYYHHITHPTVKRV